VNTDLATSNSLADISARLHTIPGRIAYEPPPGTKTNPYLDCFPMMTEHEFAGLVWSVKRRGGLLCPISRDKDGVILDGRCRLMACLATGIEPKFETVDLGDEDPLDFIIRKNLLRAHRTPSERAIADAITETWLKEPDPEFSALVFPEARLVLKYEYLAEAVKAGTLSIGAAYQKALEQKKEAALIVEHAERLERFRKEAPFLAIQVDDGKLTLDQAIATAEEQAVAPTLAEHAEAIRIIGRRMVADVMEIGRRLTECKALLQHGAWLPWLEREFGCCSESTALNFMRVHRAFGPNPQLVTDLDLPMNTFYLLARPSTPDSIRDEILARAQNERIPHGDVKRLIDAARGKTSSPGNRLEDDLRDLADRMAEERPDDPFVAELRRLVSGEAAE
jgi:hypothetical protein